jgi:integrase
VYAGIDPVTKRRHNLIEVVPPGPKAWRDAEKIRDRFLNEVAEKRNSQTSATVGQLLTRYLNQFGGAPNTLANYRAATKTSVFTTWRRVHNEVLDTTSRIALISINSPTPKRRISATSRRRPVAAPQRPDPGEPRDRRGR